MIPDFLKPFETQLEDYKKKSTKIKATPLEDSPINDSLSLTESKILGLPFLPESVSYPTEKDGSPMLLLAQINFSDAPKLEGFPETGLLQLYLSTNEWFEDGYKILYFDENQLKQEPRKDFSILSLDDYEEMPAWKVHRLSFEKSLDVGGYADSTFDITFNGLDYWSFEDTLETEQKDQLAEYFNASGHKMGGYAEFTQDDPRGYNPSQANDIQLLQIDTDDEIMFGDGGVGHIFISTKNLKNKQYDKAYFYWDCC